MFLEDTFQELIRFGAFHEHIGCTVCDAFYEVEVRFGPIIHFPGPGHTEKYIGFSRIDVKCELYGVANAMRFYMRKRRNCCLPRRLELDQELGHNELGFCEWQRLLSCIQPAFVAEPT